MKELSLKQNQPEAGSAKEGLFFFILEEILWSTVSNSFIFYDFNSFVLGIQNDVYLRF